MDKLDNESGIELNCVKVNCRKNVEIKNLEVRLQILMHNIMH